MTSYLDADAFATLSVMPSEMIDDIEANASGWLDAQLEMSSAKIDARLVKRYAVPFTTEPYPLAVRGWLAQIVTFRAYLRRGVDPTDAQMVEVKNDHDNAWAEIKEAADAENGLFELPLRQDTSASGIAKTSTLAYSEHSPFVAFDQQADIGRDEDVNRGGTFT